MAINLLNELTKKKLFNIMIKLFEKTHDASAHFKIQYGALFGLASRANGDRGGGLPYRRREVCGTKGQPLEQFKT